MNIKMFLLGIFLENPCYTLKTPTRIVVTNKGFGGNAYNPQYLVIDSTGRTSWRNFRERASVGFWDKQYTELKLAQEYLVQIDRSLDPTWDVVETNWK